MPNPNNKFQLCYRRVDQEWERFSGRKNGSNASAIISRQGHNDVKRGKITFLQ
jgi:hypothetical protein